MDTSAQGVYLLLEALAALSPPSSRPVRAIARIEPVAADSAGNPFLKRRILPEFAALKGRLGGGTDSTALVRADRDRG